MASAARYDDIGTVNSVKLIPKINSYNGYIQLYTELDSHIEVGDTVFITYSGDTAELGDMNLDNMYFVLQEAAFLYNNYAQGYNVLYVNKNTNSFVIDRFIYTLPSNSRINGHYVSTVSASNIDVTGGEIDGTFMRNGTIIPTSNIDVTQIVMLYGEMENVDINDKYETGYISLLLDYNAIDNTYIKYSNINNSLYGYSYFYNVPEILNCNISVGLYFNSTISASAILTKKINGGFFSNCYIDNYEIQDGYMNNTILSNYCDWFYGSWDGGTFTLSTWTDGIFINGTFGNNNNAIWENGTFYNGVWSGLYWINGDFAGGQFKGQNNIINGEGQIVYTEWFAGNFIDGKMYNDNFYSDVPKSGNSFHVKEIKVTGGEIYNASVYGGSFSGGKIYNSSIKNCNICDGDFIANLENVDYKYNRISNCNIYGGNFVGEWWTPIYLETSSEFVDSKYGLNEISESTIYDGDFRYTHFYGYNEIKNGEYDSCLFLSPIDVRNGIFRNGTINYVKSFDGDTGYTSVISQKTNYFGSEKFNFSKATIRKKELLNSSNILVTKILLEFSNGHNFTAGDSGKTINLVGFKSQELWDAEYTILDSETYYDPSTYGTTGNPLPYGYFEPVGDSYIVINGVYKDWFYNDSGIVRKVDYFDLLSEFNDDFYHIYNGKYTECYMRGVEIPLQVADDDIEIDTGAARTNTTYGNIKIYLGDFKNSYLQNGVVWFNGQFDGGLFVSDFGVGPENHWFSGNFYGGVFGDNSGGDLETITVSIWNQNAYIIDKSGSTGEQTNEWSLIKIYPLKYTVPGQIDLEERLEDHNLMDNIISWGDGSYGSASAFLPQNRNTIPHNIQSDFVNDYAKNTMNIEPWSEQNLVNVSPYEFIFVVKCLDGAARIKLKAVLDSFNTNQDDDFYVGLIDTIHKNTPVSLDPDSLYIKEPYKLFERLYTDNYDYSYVDYSQDDTENLIYIRFRFREIEKLYVNANDDEFVHFNNNYRSVWSIANTGYYTHPMPVLYDEENENYGYDDLVQVGKFVIYGSLDGEDSVNEDSGWIYGTCPPPWWYYVPDATTTSTPYINWTNAQVGTITKISTKKPDNTQINNNDDPVEFFEIELDDILPRLQDSWIMRDLYGVNDQNDVDYPGDFRHIIGETTSRDATPIPYSRKLVEWYRHYIFLNKNKTGFNCDPKIKYTNVHDENKTKQLLYDPSFNNVEDYKTEPVWDLGGIQEGRVNKGTSYYNRPSMIYNTKAYNAKLVGNKLYFSNTVNFTDKSEEDIFNFDNFSSSSWDKYIRVTKRTEPTQLNFSNLSLDNELEVVEFADFSPTDSPIDTPTNITPTSTINSVNTSTEISDRIDAENNNADAAVIEEQSISIDEDRAERGGFASLPEFPLNNIDVFDDGTYEVLDVVQYSYVDDELGNYLVLDVPDEYIDQGLVVDVEVFKQGRGIILPYFYKVQNVTNWLNEQDSMSDNTINGGNPAKLISYKDYGQKLALKMEPIFHNYAFNGKETTTTVSVPTLSDAVYNNRNIFGVRIVKVVPENGELVENDHFRIIFNSLYENPDQIFKKYPTYEKSNEPLIGAHSFFTESNNLPGFSGPSYYVDPTDLLQSLRYSVDSKNWISMMNFAQTDAYTYNNFLVDDLFYGTWEIANSGLTGTDDTSYYNNAEQSGPVDLFNNRPKNKDRVYFDIVDSRLNTNTNLLYPTLLRDDIYTGALSIDFATEDAIWGIRSQLTFDDGGAATTASSTNNYNQPNTNLFTNNILSYKPVNSSVNYTRFSTGFKPYVFFDEDIGYVIDSIQNESVLTQNRTELSGVNSSSHTDFRVYSPTLLGRVFDAPTSVPSVNPPSGAIRFPDEEITMSGETRKTGAIWIKKPGAWEEKWDNKMDRHYKLKVKIIKRNLYRHTQVDLNETGTTISVIFGDQIYTKTGADVVNRFFGVNEFPTIEFEVYHHLIKGETWSDDMIGVIVENAEFETNCINEYYITELTLEYDPLNYVDMFATLEPEVECAGRIVKLRTEYGDGTAISPLRHKTISTKILDYDWLNKSYIFDIDAETTDLLNFSRNNIYLATNMRSYNIFDFPVTSVTELYSNSVVGYSGVKKWVLPPWSTNTNTTINDTGRFETIYQKSKGDNFSKKDCMMEIRYLSNDKYYDGTGEDIGSETYHDSMGDHPFNKPVNYSLFSGNGTFKNTQMSLINLSDYAHLGKEYFDYGVLKQGMNYETFVPFIEHIIGAFGLPPFESRDINDAIYVSELTPEGQADVENSLNNDIQTAEYEQYNGSWVDNPNYWFGPLRSYWGATVGYNETRDIEGSDIESSEHPAYWTGGYWKKTNDALGVTEYGVYEAGTPMQDNYTDVDGYKWTIKYYDDAVFDPISGAITDVTGEYSFNNGYATWNMTHLRGWKHIGRWTDRTINHWVPGAYEGNASLQGNYVDLFKTIPMSDSGLERIDPDDGVAIFINQPNVYFKSGYSTDDDSVRTVIKTARIVEKVDNDQFDEITDSSTNTDYSDFRVDGFNGMSKFGLEMWKHNNTFRIMSHNYLFSYSGYLPEYNVVWYYEIRNFTRRHNFHDIALFNAYHQSKIDDNEYQNVLFDEISTYNYVDSGARNIYNMFYDMFHENNTFIDQYSEYYTGEIQYDFESMNEYAQTSVQNFNKKSGIQIHTINVGISPSSYTDHWYDGTFYDGIFNGKWYNGQWINGVWGPGYNYISAELSGISNYYLDALSTPDFVNIGFVEKEPYEVNYELLKKKDLYYEISPWDEANKKKSEVVKLPLRKKDRKL